MIRAVCKIGGTLAALVGVWAGLAFLGGESVSTSRADILDFGATTTGDRAFRQVLDELGHEQPRRYIVNGNPIHVSTATLDRPPRRALERYQQAFARQGLNDRSYTDLSPLDAVGRTTAGLTGGLVPAIISPDRVVMRGVSPRREVDGPEELLELPIGGSDSPSAMAETFEGFRWVELHRPAAGHPTKAVAIWSGEDFDYDRMFPAALERRADRAAPDLPSCPNCVLVNQFADPQTRSRSEAYLFVSDRTPARLDAHFESECRTPSEAEAAAAKWRRRLRQQLAYDGASMRRRVCRTDAGRFAIKLFPTERERTAVRIERLPADALDGEK